MAYTILIAEDDEDIINLVSLYLESNGYQVLTAANGSLALSILEKNKVDLAILDIMMPKIDGYEVASRIREKYTFPIIFLSAKNQDEDKILGLNLGADDYITKPFNPLELLARVNAALRRVYQLGKDTSHQNSLLKSGQLVVDLEAMTVKKGDTELFLTPTEFKILCLFMKSPGKVFTKAQIYRAVTGDEFVDSDENSIIVHISKLREKLGDNSKNPEYIKNIRGLGYKIEKK